MPWWVGAYFVVFSLFAVAAMGGELKKGNVFQAVVEAVPFFSSVAGGISYWTSDPPTKAVATALGAMLALGVPLLVADTVVGEREARAEKSDHTLGMTVLTWAIVFGMFVPAYVWSGMYVARAWR